MGTALDSFCGYVIEELEPSIYPQEERCVEL